MFSLGPKLVFVDAKEVLVPFDVKHFRVASNSFCSFDVTGLLFVRRQRSVWFARRQILVRLSSKKCFSCDVKAFCSFDVTDVCFARRQRSVVSFDVKHLCSFDVTDVLV